MKINLIMWLTLAVVALQAQGPSLRIFLDSVQLKDNTLLSSLTAKVGSKEYSIINTEKTRIVLPPNIDVLKIEALKFILKTDTIVFTIDKIVGDTDFSSDIVRPDIIEIIFHSLKRWDLHIDQFKYYIGDKVKVKNETQRRNCYKDYKIYALRTINWKYYVVKL